MERLIIQFDHKRRRTIAFVISIIATLGVIFLDLIWVIYNFSYNWSIYRKGINSFSNKNYLVAAELFSQIDSFKDSLSLGKLSIKKHIQKCNSNGCYTLGKINDAPIKWLVVNDDKEIKLLLSESALVIDCIHSSSKIPKQWKECDLYCKLQTDYKNQWFNEFEKEILFDDVSILTIEYARNVFSKMDIRQCTPIELYKGMLVQKGNAFWWLRRESNIISEKMPIVTAEGLISEQGLPVAQKGIAVRPVIKLKVTI